MILAGHTVPMASNENELSIRSRHGALRDLLPIYSLYQLLPNLVALGFILWLSHGLEHFPTVGFFVVMLGWVFQFVSRPCVMTVSKEQAAWLEAILDEQGFYGQSESDGRWRTLETQSWQRWPHQFIEFAPGDGVTLIAPRDVMVSLRASLELLEEHGELSYAPENRPFAFQTVEPEPLPWHMHVPTAVLGAACVIAWIGLLFTGGSDSVSGWGVSGMALSQGRYETIFLHMFAHGGAMHLVMNVTMLVAIGGTLTARLGRPPLNWLRFLLLFVHLLLLRDFSITLNGVFNAALSHTIFEDIGSTSVVRTVSIVVAAKTLSNECLLTDYALTRGDDGSLTWSVPGVLADGTVPDWTG